MQACIVHSYKPHSFDPASEEDMSMNFMRGTRQLVRSQLLGTRRKSYAAAVVEVDEGLSGRSYEAEYEYQYETRGVEDQEEVRCEKGKTSTKKETRNIEECEWVPHPRSGIYFPKGHDWVLEDVPHSVAASSSPAFWIRNVDGVDRPYVDDF